MLAPHQQPLSIDEFLEWAQLQDDRFELVEGVPVRMMAGAKQSHNVVVGNMADAMRAAAKAAGCRTTSNDTAVVTSAGGVRYPDIVIDCGPVDPDALTASWPVIIVEVLSRSTSQIDFSDKLDEYKNCASVDMILLVDPDVVSVKAYRRDGSRAWVSEKYEDPAQSIELPRLGTTISLRDIYDTLSPKVRPRIEVVRHVDPV